MTGFEFIDQFKNDFDAIELPGELDLVIVKAMKKGKDKKRIKFFKPLSIAAGLIVAFIASVNISPAFANSLENIPGLQHIMELVRFDKGLESALENNFVHQVNLSDTHEDITLTIDNIIADTSKMIVFYTLENHGVHQMVNIRSIEKTDENGQQLSASTNWSAFINQNMNIHKKLHGRFDINFGDETVISNKININIRLEDFPETPAEMPVKDTLASDPLPREEDRDRYMLDSTWSFTLPIDKSSLETLIQTYQMNETVSVEGQKITFKNVTIYPTQIGIEVEFNPSNTKKIFAFEDLRIIDEKGEVWGSIKNGVSATNIIENSRTLYLESNFFTNPRSLYLKGSSFRAIDKDKLEVVFDIEKQLLLKAPDERLTFDSIQKAEDGLELRFILKVDPLMDKNYSYSLFSSVFRDAEGYEYNSSYAGSSSFNNNFEDQTFGIPADVSYHSPLILTLDDYPARITGEFTVKVK